MEEFLGEHDDDDISGQSAYADLLPFIHEYKCAGMPLNWLIGPIFDTYPWQIHNSPMEVPWAFYIHQTLGLSVVTGVAIRL